MQIFKARISTSEWQRVFFLAILGCLTIAWAACGGGSGNSGGGGGKITTIAGNNQTGFLGDTGDATKARLNAPAGVAVDSSGNYYIADFNNNRVRKVTSGKIDTVAGSAFAGYTGDGGVATSATLNGPYAVAVDSNGNLYIADQLNHAVRKVSSGGTITTIAGTGVAGYNGDNIAATTAQLNLPSGVAVDSSGNVFIADYANHRIREVLASNGNIVTVAGTGTAGFSGDNGAATAAQLSSPISVALDKSGNLFICDQSNNRIREVSSGTIKTIAGTGTGGNSGDNGDATKAELANPTAVTVDASGNVYIADAVSERVRRVTGGNIYTTAGTGVAGFTGDGGAATSAELNGPHGLATDANGSLYIADSRNQVIRLVKF